MYTYSIYIYIYTYMYSVRAHRGGEPQPLLRRGRDARPRVQHPSPSRPAIGLY